MTIALVAAYSPQVENVFDLIKENIQYAYNTQNIDIYLSHQISNAMVIKL